MKARNIALGLVAVAVLAVVAPASAKINASAHFVPSEFTGAVDRITNDVVVGYMAAGLGNGGAGFVSAKGWVRISAECKNGSDKTIKAFEDKTWRVNDRNITGDQWGNYKGTAKLPPAAPCPPGTQMISARVIGESVTVTLKRTSTSSVLDSYAFADNIS